MFNSDVYVQTSQTEDINPVSISCAVSTEDEDLRRAYFQSQFVIFDMYLR